MRYAIVTPMQADLLLHTWKYQTEWVTLSGAQNSSWYRANFLRSFHTVTKVHNRPLLRHAVSQMNPVKLSLSFCTLPWATWIQPYFDTQFLSAAPCPMSHQPRPPRRTSISLWALSWATRIQPMWILSTPTWTISSHLLLGRYAVAQLDEALHYKPEGRGFDSRWGNWDFLLAWSFRPHYSPGVDSATNRHEYRRYLVRGKGGRCVRADNLATFMCRIV
jgi:hypothetical protein